MQLSPWQPAWAGQAQVLAQELAQALRAELPSATVEPIGSTAVPGLCAKPVIDLMLGVSSLDEVLPDRLARLGYRYRPEHEAAIPERRYFTREADATLPRVHLHALVQGGLLWTRHLRFRDALRADPLLRDEYAKLKTELAQRHAADKAAYQHAKAPFILGVLGLQHRMSMDPSAPLPAPRVPGPPA